MFLSSSVRKTILQLANNYKPRPRTPMRRRVPDYLSVSRQVSLVSYTFLGTVYLSKYVKRKRKGSPSPLYFSQSEIHYSECCNLKTFIMLYNSINRLLYDTNENIKKKNGLTAKTKTQLKMDSLLHIGKIEENLLRSIRTYTP